MNSIFCALVAVATVLQAHATDLSAITKAKSSLALELTLASRAELKERRDQCNLELSGLELPRSCFEVLNLEESMGLIVRSRAGEQRLWLERLCLKRARGAARLEALSRTSALSSSCRQAAEERLDDLRYRLEDERPQDLFQNERSDVR
ncbi:MAG: hypothetical protein V4760_06075 [Bdellovibrionota bacterium]